MGEGMSRLLALIDDAAEACGSAAELARRIGVTRQRVSALRTGRNAISPESVALIAGVAGVSGAAVRELAALAVTENPKNAEIEPLLRQALFGDVVDDAVDPRDAVMQRNCPCVSVPRFGALAPLAEGMRTLVGSNGVFSEFKNAAMHCVVRAGALDARAQLPYGRVEQHLTLQFGRVPRALYEQFIAVAREAYPNECAGAVIFNGSTGKLRFEAHESASASGGHVDYRIRPLGREDVLVLDLHSHGNHAAFWSATDDVDDDGGIRLCGVVGNLGSETISEKFRLSMNGLFVTVSGEALFVAS